MSDRERRDQALKKHATGETNVVERRSERDGLGTRPMGRRSVLKAGAVGAGATMLGSIGSLAATPIREAFAAPTTLPDIQFDIGNFIRPAFTVNDGAGPVVLQFGPVFTVHGLYKLTRTPTRADQQVLASALNTIEEVYPFSPSGVFLTVMYGLPYFNRLPRSLVQSTIPKLASNPTRLALEEAVPSPTDVSPVNPGITKVNFNIPVTIEANDLHLQLRSDSLANTETILAWLAGSNRLGGRFVPSPRFNGLLRQTGTRVMFQQIGLPRKVANANRLPFAGEINPNSPMWMGFADQQTDGGAPSAQTVTFVGDSHAHLTTAKPGDYFDNGSIQHLSHVIEDLAQFYAEAANAVDPNGPEPFTERCQYMFRSNPIPSVGNTDQFTNGGGPAFIDNTFQGTGDAAASAQAINTFNGEHRIGHLNALQRSSRAADGTPLHIRNDGTGFNNLDSPNGQNLTMLEFVVFVPTADFFTTMRANQAALDLQNQFGVDPADNGLERFLTATRRQNFLVPPRRHRAFPLVELAGGIGTGR
ncbi:MAG: hypothetical protein J2P58_05470 [Acidimicrobiaceae bacterium]|nr:hypothetical protein [Acidimicrobiaceae bacterium]